MKAYLEKPEPACCATCPVAMEPDLFKNTWVCRDSPERTERTDKPSNGSESPCHLRAKGKSTCGLSKKDIMLIKDFIQRSGEFDELAQEKGGEL